MVGGIFGFFPRTDGERKGASAGRKKRQSARSPVREDLLRGDEGARLRSCERGKRTFENILDAVSTSGLGGLDSVGSLTFAQVWKIARNRKIEDWDKVAFVASYALNSGGFKKWIRIENPFRVEYKQVELEELDIPGMKTVRTEDESSDISEDRQERS